MSEKNNDITIRSKPTSTYKSLWGDKEGVFETPQGKFIVRIKGRDRYTTISQHGTQEAAQTAYDKAICIKK